jgi:hypothetical protein
MYCRSPASEEIFKEKTDSEMVKCSEAMICVYFLVSE